MCSGKTSKAKPPVALEKDGGGKGSKAWKCRAPVFMNDAETPRQEMFRCGKLKAQNCLISRGADVKTLLSCRKKVPKVLEKAVSWVCLG